MRKILLICAAIVALAAIVTGTFAFFTDSVEGYGQVASGELSILQHEYEYAADGVTLRPYTQNQMIYPAVFVNKIVTAENIGSLNAFVRTFVAVPTAGENMPLATLDTNTDEWAWDSQPIKNQLINGTAYDIYSATYLKPLAVGETTSPSLLGYTVSPHVSQDGTQYVYRNGSSLIPLGTNDAFTILVATEASQAIVFENAAEAMKATYGDDHHPWQTVKFVAGQAELDAAILAAASDYNTRICLQQGRYTLPAKLPNGIRLLAMDANVTADNTSFTGYDIEIDGITFENALSFSGHGSFQEVTFLAGCTATPTTGNILFDHCTGAPSHSQADAYQVIVQP